MKNIIIVLLTMAIANHHTNAQALVPVGLNIRDLILANLDELKPIRAISEKFILGPPEFLPDGEIITTLYSNWLGAAIDNRNFLIYGYENKIDGWDQVKEVRLTKNLTTGLYDIKMYGPDGSAMEANWHLTIDDVNELVANAQYYKFSDETFQRTILQRTIERYGSDESPDSFLKAVYEKFNPESSWNNINWKGNPIYNSPEDVYDRGKALVRSDIEVYDLNTIGQQTLIKIERRLYDNQDLIIQVNEAGGRVGAWDIYTNPPKLEGMWDEKNKVFNLSNGNKPDQILVDGRRWHMQDNKYKYDDPPQYIPEGERARPNPDWMQGIDTGDDVTMGVAEISEEHRVIGAKRMKLEKKADCD